MDTDDCILWHGSISRGYGKFRMPHVMNANRAAYLLFVGDIPEGLFVLHRCHNSTCVNPRHLYTGTQFENMQQMVRDGRHYKKARYQPKVTWAIADAIRADIRPQEQIAHEYGISRSTVSNIKNGRTWARQDFKDHSNIAKFMRTPA